MESCCVLYVIGYMTMGFLNKNIFSLEDRLFAIDLSDHSVKVLELEKEGENHKIRSFNSAKIPRGFINDGRMEEKEKVAEIIKSAVKNAAPKKIRNKKVVCSLPESKVFLRTISIPKMNQEEAHEAVKWELEASIPLSVDQVYFDWQFLDEVSGKQNVLTVAIDKEIVENTIGVLEMAGLSVFGLEAESISTVRSLIPKDISKKELSLIIDLGSSSTSFIITEGRVPYFTSSIPFSSDGITDILVKTLKISEEEAERIKTSHGVERSYENNAVFIAIKPLLENLIMEVEKSMDFYHSIKKDSQNIEKIIVCGGGANLKGLVPYLANRLCREITVGDPWVNLSLGNALPIITKNEAVSYATAVGLII